MQTKEPKSELVSLDPGLLDQAVGGTGIMTAIKWGAKGLKYLGSKWNKGAKAVETGLKPTSDAGAAIAKTYGTYEAGAATSNGLLGTNLPTPVIDRATGK